MITITEGLYLHRAGDTLILSDRPQPLLRTTALHPKILIVSNDQTQLKSVLRHWLSSHQLDEISVAMKISRSAAHRLRAAMGITKRGSYAK